MAGINLMDRHMAIAASPHTENQNDSIITTKKALALPAKDVTIGIEPVQDLHGYDHPWPAEGGKNVMHPATVVTPSENLTVTNNNGKITINGTTTQGSQVYLSFDSMTIQEGYIVALMNSFTDATLYFLKGKTQIDYFSLGTVNRVINTTSMTTLYGKEFDKIRILFNGSVTLSNANFSPMVVLDGADTTTWSPYSNICPISGWTGANANRTGFNVWDGEWEFGNISESTGGNISDGGTAFWRSKNYIPVIPSAVYCHFTNGYNGAFRHFFYDENKNFISFSVPVVTESKLTFKIPAGAYFMRFRYYTSLTNYKNCINLSDPAKNGTYEPGHVVTYPISWQSEAGTVYGGTLDVTTGLLTVDGILYQPPTTGWTKNSHRFQQRLVRPSSDIAAVVSESNSAEKSTHFGIASQSLQYGGYADCTVSVFYAGSAFTDMYIGVQYDAIDTVAAFMSYLSEQVTNGTPFKVFYELATPQTYQLTPTEVQLLLDDNNVWADTGDVTMKFWSH